MTDIDKYISNLENEFKNYESNVFDNADFDKKLLILYAYYHYFVVHYRIAFRYRW